MISEEQILVTKGHDAERGLMLRVLAYFVFGITAIFLQDLDWVGPWANVAMGAMIGHAAFSPLRRAGAYRNGWIDGRLKMVADIRRFERPEEWLHHQIDYDTVHVMGLQMHDVPDSPEGLQ